MPAAVLAGLIVVALLYARGLRRGRRRPPYWRPPCFFAGLLAILLALASPIDALAHELFSVHMAQHMLLTLAAAPLLHLGAPIVPLARGLPRPLRRAVLVPLARSAPIRAAVHLVRRPLVAAALYIAGLYAWHIPAIYDAALDEPALHSLEHLYFLASALIFWAVVIDPEPFRSPLGYPLRILFLLLSGAAQNTILGGLLSFSSRLLYAHYVGRPEAFGIDALTDQRAGGALMWVPGDLIFLSAASLCFFLFLAQEEREQLRREGR